MCALLLASPSYAHRPPHCGATTAAAAAEQIAARHETTPAKLAVTLAKENARKGAAEIADERLQLLESFLQADADARACGAKTNCLLRVWRRVSTNARSLRQVLISVVSSERHAQEHLLQSIEEQAKTWVEQNYEQLTQMYVDVPEAGELTTIVAAELRKLVAEKGLTKADVYDRIRNGMKEVWDERTMKSLRANPKARVDYAKCLSLTLAIQGFAHAMTIAQDLWLGKSPSVLVQLWLYFNTFFMISLQSTIGARNTADPKAPPVGNFDEALRAIPTFLHGDHGFRTEVGRKILAFAILLPLEYLFSVGAKLANVAATRGADALGDPALWLQTATVNFIAVGIAGAYQLLRWSFVDKWVNLNLFPAYSATTAQRRDAAWEQAQAAHPELKDWTPRDVAILSSNWAWRNLPFWRRVSPTARQQFRARRAVYEKIFTSPDVEAALTARSNNWRARSIEWSWRIGQGVFDAYMIFRLFGTWIPQLLGVPTAH